MYKIIQYGLGPDNKIGIQGVITNLTATAVRKYMEMTAKTAIYLVVFNQEDGHKISTSFNRGLVK